MAFGTDESVLLIEFRGVLIERDSTVHKLYVCMLHTCIYIYVYIIALNVPALARVSLWKRKR